MDHDGFMTGMLWGGALVASVPTALLIGVGIYALRQYRAERRRTGGDDATGKEGPE